MTHATEPDIQVTRDTVTGDIDKDDWTADWSSLGWLDAGYLSARFGDEPVLLTSEFAAQVHDVKDGK